MDIFQLTNEPVDEILIPIAYLLLSAIFEIFLTKSSFSKNSFRNTFRMSNSFDPDHARHSVGRDLGSNCLQRLSADDTSRQRFKE